MSAFTVVVFDSSIPVYVAGHHDDRTAADDQIASMIDEVDLEGENTFYVFDTPDDIVLIDGKFNVLSAWNRRTPKAIEDFSEVDFQAFLRQDAARRNRKFIGFHIADLDGNSVQGTAKDPFQLSASDVLIDAAVLTAKGWATDRDYLIIAVSDAEIETPNFVGEISITNDTAMSPGM